MNDVPIVPPLRAAPFVPRVRRPRGRWIADVILLSLGLHLLILAFVLFAPPEAPPPIQPEAPSVDIVMGDANKPPASTETPSHEVGVGVTAAPANSGQAPGPPAPPPQPEPQTAPPTPAPPPIPAPPIPEPPPPEPAPTAEVPPAPVPLPPAPAIEAPPTPPAAPAPEPAPPAPVEELPSPPVPPPPPPSVPAPRPAAPAVPRRPSPPSFAARPVSPFAHPQFSFGGGLGALGSGSSTDHAPTNLLAGTARQGRNNPASGLSIKGDDLGPDWNSLMEAWWREHRYYPREAAEQGQDGTVSVTVHMGPDGRVHDVELADRSGSQWLDLGAQSIFRNAHLPPFPWNETRKEAVMTFEIHYILVR